MDKYVVFYESWQMECCGTEFSIGDKVKWIVCAADPCDDKRVDYFYEAHSSDWEKLFVLEGRAEKIKISYRKYVPSESNPRLYIPADEVLIETKTARGFEEDMDSMTLSGYAVLLSECMIRAAKADEVTFR